MPPGRGNEVIVPVDGGVADNNNYVVDNNGSGGGGDCSPAIYIRNLCKTYPGGPPVLKNLCMNVKRGTIYGLLGASGCGKTTILSIIVGLEKWDAGEILVFGEEPGNVKLGKRLGYMPQDLALYEELTIYEMIQFYGRIYNMTAKEVKEKWKFLKNLLQLPTDFKVIGNLSGGQKRRASLCLALMQGPDLIILDEPTVGLDPLLRRSIWNHLYKIVNSLQTTIIITTHYIEEARLSNTIGFVRKGRLLVEDTPSRLLSSFKLDLIEEVVLRLCRQDENEVTKNLPKVGETNGLQNHHVNNREQGNPMSITFKVNGRKDRRRKSSLDVVDNHENVMNVGVFRKSFDCGGGAIINENEWRSKVEPFDNHSKFSKLRQHPFYASFQRIKGLTTVIILAFIRHPLFLATVLLLPAIHGSVTLATIGMKPKDLPLAVVNNELLNWTEACQPSNYYRSSCDLSTLSCRFLNEFKRTGIFELISVDSEEEARNLVSKGRSWGYISVPQNYSEDFVDRLVAKHFAFDESINGSIIRATLDYSQSVVSLLMMEDLYDNYQGYIKNLLVACQIGGREVEVPLNFRKPIYGSYEDHSYTTFLMPAVTIICLQTALTILTAVILITDRNRGTLKRAKVAGLGTSDVMISHMIVQGLIALAQTLLWSIALFVYFDFYISGPVWLYVLIILLAGLCGAAMGIVVGILCENEMEALCLGVFMTPILMLFGGVFWPMESLPQTWQYFAKALPTTLPITALRAVIARGNGLEHGLVYPGVIVLVVWTIISAIGVSFIYKKIFK